MLWRLMRRKLEQKTSQRPQFSPCADRLRGRTARRRWSQSTSQYDGKAAAKAKTVQCAQSWRLYAGNGTYTNTLGAAPCDLNSCALCSQSDKSSHTKKNTMITDATIQQAKSAVESSELELKGLSEALDSLKTEFYKTRRERDCRAEHLKMLKAEQKKLEDEARAERSTAAARKAANATALPNNRTLLGFDMETELSVNVLENQIKVKKIFLDKMTRN